MLIGVREGCLIITEITEITERVGVFFKAFRRSPSSIKMFLLKPRNACRGSRDAACCVKITTIYLPYRNENVPPWRFSRTGRETYLSNFIQPNKSECVPVPVKRSKSSSSYCSQISNQSPLR